MSTDELPGGYVEDRGDVRAVTPWLLSPAAFKGIVRRIVSVAALVLIDVGGLVLGLYGALALRSYFVDPKDRKSTRLNSSHIPLSRMPSSA